MKECSPDTGYNIEEHKKCVKWNKPESKSHILWFYFYEMFRKGKSIDTEGRLVASRGLGREEKGE